MDFQRNYYSIYIKVFLNGNEEVRDTFRFSNHCSWNTFFQHVRAALVPFVPPHSSDCLRDAQGAHVFELEVLNDREFLYFCPKGEKLIQRHPVHSGGQIQTGLSFDGRGMSGPGGEGGDLGGPQLYSFTLASGGDIPQLGLGLSFGGQTMTTTTQVPFDVPQIGQNVPLEQESLEFPAPEGQEVVRPQQVAGTENVDASFSIPFPTPDNDSIAISFPETPKEEKASKEVKEEKEQNKENKEM